MPEISRFFGIIIAMYYSDHEPPHFHVRYGEQKAIVSIDPSMILEGHLSARVLGFVVEWSNLHQEELAMNWELARQQKPLLKVDGLE